MYYTHVLSMLEYYSESIPDFQIRYFLNNLIGVMEKAQRFHLGDFSDYRENGMVPSSTEPLFYKQWGEGVRPPYDTVWCDFQDTREIKQKEEPSSPKAGVLFQRIPTNGEHYFVTPISFVAGDWRPPLISFVKHEKTHLLQAIPSTPKIQGDDINKMAYGCNRELAALNCFLRIINCKNVDTESVTPAKKLNKRRLKKGKTPLVSYKILTVNVPKRGGSSNRSTHSSGRTQRVHLCSGHYKIFTEDKPLFGKYVGTYWWQPAVRGNKKKGMVNKRYNIKLDNLD